MVASAGRAKNRTEKGPSSPADRLWTAFSRKRSIENRNRLVEFYLPQVRYNAQRIHARLPASVEIDDLISAGIFGLMDAIDAFDLSRGVKFETYSTTRIRGAMLDGLRENDWVPRLVRSRSAKLSKATEELTDGKLNERTLARRLGITKAKVADWQHEASNITTVSSLNQVVYEHHNCTGDNRTIDRQSLLRDAQQAPPDSHIFVEEWWEYMLQCLHPSVRVAIMLYFRHGWKMHVIATHLGLSESRISQMMIAGMVKLRKCRSRGYFAEITSRASGAKPKLLPLLAFCHDERRRQRRKPNAKLGSHYQKSRVNGN